MRAALGALICARLKRSPHVRWSRLCLEHSPLEADPLAVVVDTFANSISKPFFILLQKGADVVWMTSKREFVVSASRAVTAECIHIHKLKFRFVEFEGLQSHPHDPEIAYGMPQIEDKVMGHKKTWSLLDDIAIL